jgi:RNA recognition motif-containing protein
MPIYLEFAPEGIIGEKEESEKSAEESQGEEDKENREKTVFIKNLNFTTTENQIEEIFSNANLKGKVLSVKIVRNKDN